VVAALVGASAFGAGECSQEGGLGGGQGGAEVEGVGEVGVALGGGSDVDLGGQLAQFGHPFQAILESGLVADHSAGLPHEVAHGSLQGAGEVAAGADEAGQLVGGGSDHLGGPQLGVAAGRVGGGGLPGPAAEDDRLGQGVAAEPVGAVEPGGDLAGGVQPGHLGGMGLRVDHHPAHRVVGGGGDLHGLLGDVQQLVVQELPVHAGQLLQDGVLAEVGDVQEHPAVGAATSLGDLGVVGQRHPVAGRQLHPLGVVAGHEPLPEGVGEVAALTPDGLGDQGPGGLLGATIPVGWNWTSSMSWSGQPARKARYMPSPVFSSRREDDRRQIRVWPPAASTTASARNTVRWPVSRSKARAPKQTPSATSSWDTYWSSITVTPDAATLAASVRRIARPVQSPA
jgi:hypothetical protein